MNRRKKFDCSYYFLELEKYLRSISSNAVNRAAVKGAEQKQTDENTASAENNWSSQSSSASSKYESVDDKSLASYYISSDHFSDNSLQKTTTASKNHEQSVIKNFNETTPQEYYDLLLRYFQDNGEPRARSVEIVLFPDKQLRNDLKPSLKPAQLDPKDQKIKILSEINQNLAKHIENLEKNVSFRILVTNLNKFD